ncbi:MAG: EamA family transporter, partial [Clostridiaceae bacterium]|nr:EamA family transporter [Clostridiaceae bacterium]
TSPINASIVTTFLPIITMVISAFYLKEPITLKKLLGVIVGGAGAVLIIISSTQLDAGSSESNRNLMGILLVFMAQTSYAIYFVFFKNFVGKYSPITLMKWMFLFASITYLPFGQSEFLHLDYTAIPFSVYKDIAFVVLGSTFLTYLMVPIGQKNLRPTVASMYNNVQPIVATIAAAVMGIDAFGLLKGIAIALVFIGVYIVNRSKAAGELKG